MLSWIDHNFIWDFANQERQVEVVVELTCQVILQFIIFIRPPHDNLIEIIRNLYVGTNFA